MSKTFDPEAWAVTQPHTFFSHWPTALRTKCDFCGVHYEDHTGPVDDDVNVARNSTRAIPAGQWSSRKADCLPAGVEVA